MKLDADVVVAGAGPAGLAAASYAARVGMHVLVLDPRHGVIDKACGEGIMPGGVEALAELGVFPRGVPFRGIRYADGSDASLFGVGTFPRGRGLGVRRTELQARMKARALELGVRFEEVRVKSFEQTADVVVVNDTLRTRWLIGADGLHSRLRRLIGAELPCRGPARLGLRRHFDVAPWSDRVEVYFGRDAEAYVTPVDTNLVGVALLFDSKAQADFDAMLEQFPLLRERLGEAAAASRLRGAGPFEQNVAKRVEGNVLLVGDAAGYVDPLTGEGIALGLATSRAAVGCLLEGTAHAYEARYQRIVRRHVLATRVLLSLMRRRSTAKVVLHAARSFPGAFDEVLGLLAHGPDLGIPSGPENGRLPVSASVMAGLRV